MSAILGMWPEQFVYILANLSKGVFIWNLSLIGQMIFWENYALILWKESNMSDLKRKVNHDFVCFVALCPTSTAMVMPDGQFT